MWDVFICHAWEDKDTIARPLAHALQKEGLRVWYDEFTLKVGDSLRRSIDHGLSESRYGVVILSPHFFAKEWPQRELDGLVAKEINSGKIILPIWHNITRKDVERHSPPLADKLAVSTANGLDKVLQELLRVINPKATSKFRSANEIKAESGITIPNHIWCNKGVVLGKLGRHEEAIECYDKALKINPQYAMAWRNKGVALKDLRRTK